MPHRSLRLLLAAFVLTAFAAPAQQEEDAEEKRGITPLPFTSVKVEDAFWSPRLATNRNVTIPYAMRLCEETGRIANFEEAAKRLAGAKEGKSRGYFFNDSDVYKVIEAVGYALAVVRDPELESKCDAWIDLIAAAQEKDGYLYTARTIFDPTNMPPGGKERWSNMESGHELYCAGHLYEAAIAYHQATGKRKLLDVALKHAALAASVFGPEGNPHPCGHPEIEIALCKLYRHTGEQRWLDLARFFLETRGRGEKRRLYGAYAQDHLPLAEQTEIVGHAVRAAYLFTGAADVAALSGESRWAEISDRLWHDLVSSKMYLTGGIGSRAENEGFGERFELPNASAYCETCAAIANVLWNHRLFLLHGDAKYADIYERTIYNGFLSGWSLSGDRFFYPNPLAAPKGAERAAWFACACCPSNDVRFLPSIPGLVYGVREHDVYVNLFISSTATIDFGDSSATITTKTDMPWNGRVSFTLGGEWPKDARLFVRAPYWSRGDVAPGGLYHVLGEAGSSSAVDVTAGKNGEAIATSLDKGYVVIAASASPKRQFDIEFPMPTRAVAARAEVTADRGRVAFERGPIVYCFEGVDQADARVGAFVVDPAAKIGFDHAPDLLGGVTTLSIPMRIASRTLSGGLDLSEPFTAKAIPFYAWANRGRTPMTTWVATSAATASTPLPAPTLARRSKATASFDGDLDALSDQNEPTHSDDDTGPRVHWWPKKGTTEWIQYDFPAATTVRGVEVYWFDDTGHGECRVPASWRLLRRSGEEWVEIDTGADHAAKKDTFDRRTFDAIETTALRLEISSPAGFAGGLHEWRVLD